MHYNQDVFVVHGKAISFKFLLFGGDFYVIRIIKMYGISCVISSPLYNSIHLFCKIL